MTLITGGLVENKQKFIGQIMTSKSPARSIEDVDATALSYAEVKMIATGDPRIKEKMDLDIQVSKLKMLKSNHMAQKYEMEDKVVGYYPQKIAETRLFIEALSADPSHSSEPSGQRQRFFHHHSGKGLHRAQGGGRSPGCRLPVHQRPG